MYWPDGLKASLSLPLWKQRRKWPLCILAQLFPWRTLSALPINICNFFLFMHKFYSCLSKGQADLKLVCWEGTCSHKGVQCVCMRDLGPKWCHGDHFFFSISSFASIVEVPLSCGSSPQGTLVAAKLGPLSSQFQNQWKPQQSNRTSVWLYCPNGTEWESSILEKEQVIKSELRHLFQAELGLGFSGNIWNRASVWKGQGTRVC